MAREQMMSGAWLLNALVNAMHEPNCLMRRALDDNTLDAMSSSELSASEQAFAAQELKMLRERLAISKNLISRLDEAAAKLEIGS